MTVFAAASYTGLASCSSADELFARSTTTGSLSQRPLRDTNSLPDVVLVNAAARGAGQVSVWLVDGAAMISLAKKKINSTRGPYTFRNMHAGQLNVQAV